MQPTPPAGDHAHGPRLGGLPAARQALNAAVAQLRDREADVRQAQEAVGRLREQPVEPEQAWHQLCVAETRLQRAQDRRDSAERAVDEAIVGLADEQGHTRPAAGGVNREQADGLTRLVAAIRRRDEAASDLGMAELAADALWGEWAAHERLLEDLSRLRPVSADDPVLGDHDRVQQRLHTAEQRLPAIGRDCQTAEETVRQLRAAYLSAPQPVSRDTDVRDSGLRADRRQPGFGIGM